MAIKLVSSDPEAHQKAELDRLLSIGARRVNWRYPDEADYIVLADPDGNTCCVVEKQV